MKIFEANQVNKEIDGNMILQDISVSISQGEKVAINGRNGSGKSSLLKLIGGIFEETSGSVKRAQVNIGYVPEHFPENIRFKVQEYLMLLGKVSYKSDEEILKRLKNYAERFAITNFLNTPLKQCSKGTKQKVGIIQALLKDPDVLLLDEPLTGLDDNAKTELLYELKSLGEEKTIIFTAHDPLLIEEIADRVLTIEDGRIINDATQNNKEKIRCIKAKVPNKKVIAGISFIDYKYLEDDLVELFVHANKSDKILAMLLERGCSIIELSEKR